MSTTEPTDIGERVERLRTIAVEMDRIIREVGPKLIMLAHLRSESRQILEGLGEGQGV